MQGEPEPTVELVRNHDELEVGLRVVTRTVIARFIDDFQVRWCQRFCYLLLDQSLERHSPLRRDGPASCVSLSRRPEQGESQIESPEITHPPFCEQGAPFFSRRIQTRSGQEQNPLSNLQPDEPAAQQLHTSSFLFLMSFPAPVSQDVD